MKYINLKYIAVINLLLFTFCYSQTVLDRIVAVVDKEIITESELEERLKFYALENKIDVVSPELKRQILDGMISEKLILAQAIVDSVEVTEEEVSRTLDQRITELVKRVGSEKKLEQMYGKSISRIKRDYRNEMRNQILIQKMRQQRELNLSVSQREVEKFYEMYKDSLPQVPEEFDLSHIFILCKADPEAEKKTIEFMKLLLDSLRAGADFADFARRYSMDAATAKDGGDLGWEKRGSFVREFEETVFRLKEGEISDIVKTIFGYHIIQLVERRGESVRTRHILMKVEPSPASDSVVVDTLMMIKERVLKGESFSELARIYSEDEDTKYSGGKLGVLTLEQLSPDFADVVKNMRSGEVSDPVKRYTGSSYGYQIIYLNKRTPAHVLNLQDDYNRIEQLALYLKRNKLFEEWIGELKKNFYVDVRL